MSIAQNGTGSKVGAAALALAGSGFPVFPLFEPDPDAPRGETEDGRETGGCSCQDTACKSAGKHPRTGPGGLHHATTDAEQVQCWWRRWPQAGIGLRTGCAVPGGGLLAVVDVDPRGNGDATLSELEAKHSELPTTLTVRTGSGGWHYYLSSSEPLASCKLGPGLDLKAVGGYVVAPPSLHPQGQYSTETRAPIAAAPAWVGKMAAEAAERRSGAARKNGRPTGSVKLRAAVVQSLASGRLARLWADGDHAGKDKSRSGCDAALAGLMGALGFEDLDIEAALRVFPHGQVSDTGDERQIGRLLGLAAEARERRGEQNAELVEDWPDVPRLPGPPDPEPVPTEVLPPALRAHVESVVAATQTPSALATLLALGSVSAALRGRATVQVDARGWREVVCIYAACVLPPGVRKSAVYEAMIAPLQTWEREEGSRLLPAWRHARDGADVAVQALAAAKVAAAKKSATLDEVEAARRALNDAEAAVPTLPRLVASDATPEALVRLFAEQGGTIALMGPEADPLGLADGRYSDTARVDELLRAYDGEPIISDRVGREPIKIPRAVLTMGVTVQPAALEALRHTQVHRGRGLWGRILWAIPPHGLGMRLTGRAVPARDMAAADSYARVLRVLLNTAGIAGAEPVTLALTAQALDRLYDYEAELEEGLGDGGGLEGIRDWAGKAAGRVVRLAALLELAGRAADSRPLWDPIGLWAMEGAIELTRALTSHAVAVLMGIGLDEQTEHQRYVLRRAHGLPAGSTLREL